MSNQTGQEPQAPMTEAERKAIIAGRNRVVALILAGLVVLFFAITIVKVKF